ncbi:hypothetical protein CBS101457_005053 [Exobasidium rhododendri]|nr:hypothetical protein CBS101457_005053 [Exobasidium rhododendri]
MASTSSQTIVSLDKLVRLLFVLAASARQTPALYCVALGVVDAPDQLQSKIDVWLHEALARFQTAHQHGRLSFAMLQGLVVFLVWLNDYTPLRQYHIMLEAGMSAAKALCLDRLASLAWDKEYVKNHLSTCQQSSPSLNTSWAAECLLQKDIYKRELGRAVWYGLMLLSDQFARHDGADSELETAYPGNHDPDPSPQYDPFGCWQDMSRLVPILHDWRRKQRHAEAVGSNVSMDERMAICLRLKDLEATRAPVDNLTSFAIQRKSGETSGEYKEGEKKVAQLAWSALMVQLKILLTHRSLIGRGYGSSEIHETSLRTCVESAHSILEGAHRFKELEWSHFSSSVSEVMSKSFARRLKCAFLSSIDF